MPTTSVRVLNYHPAAVWAERLRAAGYAVDVRSLRTPADLKAIGEDPPAAVAIDLSRAPSQGRDFGLGIRQQASSRRIPLVFVGGSPARVAQIRTLVPGAVCTSDRGVLPAVRQAIAVSPAEGVRPASVLAGYSGTPLPRKLGIKPGTVVRLLNAPAGFETTLGELPEGARVTRRRGGACHLTLWFVPRRRDLEEGLERVAGAVTTDRLWDRLAEEDLSARLRRLAAGRPLGGSPPGAGRLQDLRRRRRLVGSAVLPSEDTAALTRGGPVGASCPRPAAGPLIGKRLDGRPPRWV